MRRLPVRLSVVVRSRNPVLLLGLLAAALARSAPAQSIAAGGHEALAADVAGHAYRWGFEDGASLCDVIGPHPVPGPVGGPATLDGIAAVAAGEAYSLALGSDGTVWSWGDNSGQQLGQGAGASSSTIPGHVVGAAGTGTLQGISAITAGLRHSLAIRGSDGSVWAWGEGQAGQLGGGANVASSAVPVQVHGVGGAGFLTNVQAVAAGNGFSLAVAGGVVSTWGSDFAAQFSGSGSTPREVVGPGGTGQLSGVKAVAAGFDFAIALKTDGTLWAWGSGARGTMTNGHYSGDGQPGSLLVQYPIQVKGPGGIGFLTDVTDVAAGLRHVLARTSDGSAWAWGDGSVGFFEAGSNALGTGTVASPDGPFTLYPTQVLGPEGVGTLRVAAGPAPGTFTGYLAASLSQGWSLAMSPDAHVYSWGANYYGELGYHEDFPCGFGSSRRVPFEMCEPRLRAVAPPITCPTPEDDQGNVFVQSPYSVSWTDVPGYDSYEVTDDGVTTVVGPGEPRHVDHVEVAPKTRVISVRATGHAPSDCGPLEASQCTVSVVLPCTGPPQQAPALATGLPFACPGGIVPAGTPFELTWNAVPDAKHYDVAVDLGGDGSVERTITDVASTQVDVHEDARGTYSYRVRATNPCGEGPFGSSCTKRVTVNATHCQSVGSVAFCSEAMVEDPPGTFTGTGVSRFGPPDGLAGVIVDGTVTATPLQGALGWRGVMSLETVYGELALYRVQGQTNVTLPTAGEAWSVPDVAGIEPLLGGLPALPDGSTAGFDLADIPFGGLPEDVSIDLAGACVNGSASFALGTVPENPGLTATGHFTICANPFSVSGVVDQFHALAAGCSLDVAGATLGPKPGTDAPVGFNADTVELKLPIGGGVRGELNGLFVRPDVLTVEGAGFTIPPLALGPFELGGGSGSLKPRNDPALGYRICADGGFSLPFAPLGIDFGFTILGGELQRGCLGAKFPRIPIIPPVPVFIDRLAGCVELPTTNPIIEDEICRKGKAFDVQDGCLTGDCDLGLPSVSLSTGITGPQVGTGDLVAIDPVVLAIGPHGVRAGGNIKVAGFKIATGELCIAKDPDANPPKTSICAEVCADVAFGNGLVDGSGHLAIDDTGLQGRVSATLHPPDIELGPCPVCWKGSPPPFEVQATLGPFSVDERNLFGQGEITQHYGVSASAELFHIKGTAAVDLRTFHVYGSGIKDLGRFAGSPMQGGRGAAAAPDLGFVVVEGQVQAVFGAQSDEGQPVLTLLSPSGVVDASTPGVFSLVDTDRGVAMLVVDDPEPGTWQIVVTGLPLDAQPFTAAFGEATPASVEDLLPATDTSAQDVSWTAVVPAFAAPTKLRIVASPDGEMAADAAGIVVHEEELVAGFGTHHVAEGLLPAGTWWINVVLDDGLGHVTAFPVSGHLVVVDDEGPEPPTDVVATGLPGGVRLTWGPSPSPDAALYEVLVQEADDESAQAVLPAGAARTLDVDGLSPLARRFLVRAVDRSGNVGDATDAGLAAPDAFADVTPPPAPTGLVLASDGPGALTATWEETQGAASYRVHYGQDDWFGGLQAVQGASPLPATTASAELAGFTPGQRIFVAVSAVDESGNESEKSATAQILLVSEDDADADGLPDDWERLWLGSTSVSSGGEANQDGDFASDAKEQLAGTDPRVPDPFLWGDIAPEGLPDGEVDGLDLDLLREFVLGVKQPHVEESLAGNVAPADITPGPPDQIAPTDADPRTLTVADLVTLIRVINGDAELTAPF